jgi:two-component system, chemotaxis family, sensor kinase CheA
MDANDFLELKAVFFEESKEHLATMEATLLSLESAPGDPELLNQVFRAAHSIKGASGIFGFADVQRLTHGLEGLLHKLRDGAILLEPPLADLLLRATDVLRAVLRAAEQEKHAPDGFAAMLREIEAAMLAGRTPPGHELRAEDQPATTSAASGVRRYRVLFVPGKYLFRQGMDPLLVIRELAELGEVIEVNVDATELPSLEMMDPELSYLAWTLTILTDKSESQIRDIFAFVEDVSRIEVTFCDDLVKAPQAQSAVPAQGEVPRAAPGGEQPGSAARSTVRVDTAKLDQLLDLVGELVIAHSMIAAAASDTSAGRTESLLDTIAFAERNVAELQYRVLSVRMLPIGAVFARFPRLVRDTASALGKEIELVFEGEDTEIDKEMVEKLADPLTHLIRNAVDHGIEAPSEREDRGKPRAGTITVRAGHQAGKVLVEVVDDGGGLPTEKIRDKARALGLIAKDTDPSEEELHALIFAPGFSTAQEVSDVSGRGVGMDVVKRNVEALRGTIGFASRRGVGSRIELRLPLTLGIIDGLLLRVGTQTFVLPLGNVIELLRPTRHQVRSVLGRGELLCVRDQALPLVRLHRVFGIQGAETNPCGGLVCLVDADPAPVALLVDELISRAQIVVKPLEKNFRKIDGVFGATILGDGSVALIVDVPAVLRRAARNGQEQEASSDLG